MSEKKITRRKYLKYVAAGAVVAGAAAAGIYYGTGMGAGGKKDFIIGGTLPLTGGAAQDGNRILNGTKLAVDKINEEGGILGRPVKLLIYDDTFDLTKVSSLYEKLITSDNVDILVTPYGAPWAIPALGVASKYNRVMIAGFVASTSPSAQYGGKVGFFPHAMPKPVYASYQYCMYTDWLNDFDKWNDKPDVKFNKTVALVGENQLWGLEQHDIWRPKAEAQGWNIVMDEAVDVSATEFSSTILKLKELKPDLLLAEFFWFRDALLFKQLMEQQYYPNFLVMNESGHSFDWIDPEKGVGPTGNGVFTFNAFPNTNHGGDADYMRSKYKELYGVTPSAHEAAGYSAIEIIRDAVSKAGTADTDAVKNVLFKETFDTCFTPVKFDSEGSNELFVPVIAQWRNNELVPVYPASKAAGKPEYPYSPS
jgi:branched-chain amino acid transport system substrate-binding protein